MSKINNKEVLQSYILTTAKYDYSVYEKRILYRLVELFQGLIQNQKLKDKIVIEQDNQNTSIVSMPIKLFLQNETDTNHIRIKSALKNLAKKFFEYEDENDWELISVISEPKIKKNTEIATFRINPKIVEAFLDFSKGFKKYELKVAMEFESVYTMRFYELLSNQKTPINYSIDKLKDIFNIADKYKLTGGFIQKVIEPAKKELDKCSPYTFHYEPIKTGRKITGIRFIPIHQPQFEDESLKKQKAMKQMSNRWFIPKNIEDYLKYNYEFTDK
ncbi:Initiator Replication protein, partial [Algoriella xinjiangensis]